MSLKIVYLVIASAILVVSLASSADVCLPKRHFGVTVYACPRVAIFINQDLCKQACTPELMAAARSMTTHGVEATTAESARTTGSSGDNIMKRLFEH